MRKGYPLYWPPSKIATLKQGIELLHGHEGHGGQSGWLLELLLIIDNYGKKGNFPHFSSFQDFPQKFNLFQFSPPKHEPILAWHTSLESSGLPLKYQQEICSIQPILVGHLLLLVWLGQKPDLKNGYYGEVQYFTNKQPGLIASIFWAIAPCSFSFTKHGCLVLR